MTNQLSIKLGNRIKSISVIDKHNVYKEPVKNNNNKENNLSNQQIQNEGIYENIHEEALINASRALNSAALKLENIYEKAIAKHSEEIANLSIEIARKILMYKIESKDYEIVSIIKEALNNSPSQHEVTVFLNPDDYAQCVKLQEKESQGILAGIKLAPDSNIGHAECVIKNPQGTIASLIDENLDKIREALNKAY